MAEKKAPKAAPKATPKAAPKATPKAAPAMTVEILEKEIRAEAQRVFEERRAKNQAGDEVSDWLKAEVIIKKKYKLS